MTGEDDRSGGPLDVAVLEILGQRAVSHPLVDEWRFQPDTLSPRWLELALDASQYPFDTHAVRLDMRWYEGGEYTCHYLEEREYDRWQCRWDRHPKPEAPTDHFHPPPDADPDAIHSEIDAAHHLGVLFGILDWVESRIEQLHR